MENGLVCCFKDRCGTSGPGCDAGFANASSCGFIAIVEAEKKWAKDSFLEILRKSGIIVVSDENPQYAAVKMGARHLLLAEIDAVLDVAVARYCEERALEAKKVSGKTMLADEMLIEDRKKKSVYFAR